MNDVNIYALCDPESGDVRYVGKTIQPLSLRLQQHCSLSKRHTHPRAQWVHSLREKNLKPVILLLETVSHDNWQCAESRWISHFQSSGLLNSAPAGGGGTRSHLTKWTAQLDARLGKDSDATIAEEMGITRKSVSYRRRVLGIAASYNTSRMKPPPPNGGWNKRILPDELVSQLGTKPDYLLGQEFGFNKSQVARARKRLGIPSYAATTGNDGKITKGNFPRRWVLK